MAKARWPWAADYHPGMRSPAPLLLPLLAVSVLAACGSAPSADPKDSLYERRLQVIKGTGPGIVLIPAGDESPAPAPAPATAATTPAPAPAPGTAAPAAAPATAAAPAPAAKSTGALFSKLPPPTGQSPSSIKNLERKDLGITLPSSLSASQPAK